MAGGANLPGKDAAFTDDGRTGEPDLSAEHGVRADFTGVSDQDEIIDFCAAADAGFANRGAVDGGVGLNFHVVFQDGRAGLRNFVPGAVFLFGEAETIGADDRSVLEQDAIADAAVFSDDGMGGGEEIIADSDSTID